MKRLYRLSFTVLAFLIASCTGGNRAGLPSGIVPPDTMVTVISDIHLLQSSAIMGYSRNDSDTTVVQGYNSLWRKHHLTQQLYDENIKYYCDHPKLLDSIYEKVLNGLNQQKAEMMGNKSAPVKKI